MKDKNGKSALPVGRAADKTKQRRWPLPAVLLAVYDFTAIHIAYFAILWIRFDCVFKSIPDTFLVPYSRFITVYALCCLAVFWLFRMYNSIWRFASYTELSRILLASVLTSVAHIVLITVLFRRMPMTYYIGGLLLQLLFVTAARFSYRFLLFLRALHRQNNETAARVMLIGAGSAGQMILRDIRADNQANDKVVCVIDDDPNKWNKYIEGVPVVGGRDDILWAVKKYGVNKIFLAIPSATAGDKRDILDICSQTDCELKQLPGIYQLFTGQVTVAAMKDVSMEDLLGREPIRADMGEVFRFIHGKRVLVTGAGGSIGSELCRQIAAHDPEELIIFDIYENNAYEIQLELKANYPNLKLVTLIGSVRDSRRIFQVFQTYHPQIVYHAAAHKHVPLMEDSPCEAVKNNVIGTYKTAYAAMVHGCERFVLISTDKAVNPTNVMGATKRLCEMIIQCFNAKIKAGKADEIPQLFTHVGYENADKDGTGKVFQDIKTEFVAVRFGNVLGSNGSVISVFKKQIARGGPVTVTHPDVIRYFMTIPEAVSLVMLAGTYASGGEIFVLDMGRPVKIDTMAKNLIKLAGFRPGVDIQIAYTGLRPGEKLYEEKLMTEEGLRKTENKLIHIGNPISLDHDRFLVELQALMDAAYNNRADIRDQLMAMVSTYRPYDAPQPASGEEKKAG
jgi:FlaA1/EpsC-like NDP-sugar epimerase